MSRRPGLRGGDLPRTGAEPEQEIRLRKPALRAQDPSARDPDLPSRGTTSSPYQSRDHPAVCHQRDRVNDSLELPALHAGPRIERNFLFPTEPLRSQRSPASLEVSTR